MDYLATFRNLIPKLRPRRIAGVGFSFTLGLVALLSVPSAYGEHVPIRDIVLVNDSLTDNKSWNAVTPPLEKKGYKVTVVALPLTSLKDDVDIVEQTLASLKAPVLLVGHGYGGIVITEAGSNAKVAGLVYIAAYAPDVNQSAEELMKQFPSTPGTAELHHSGSGQLVLTAKGVEEDLAQDLSAADKADLVSSQRPVAGQIFSTPLNRAAWHHKPSWFIVATNDRIISPQLERDRAKTMHAKVTILQSGHVPMLSRPAKVADVIESAASGRFKYKPVLLGIGTMGMSVPFYH